MIVRALDQNGDWTFGQGVQNYLSGQAAIAQCIQTRLLMFMNNCPWAMNAGIDWITLLGKTNTLTQIQLNVRAIILQTYGVLRINTLSTLFVNRKLSLQFNIDTKYTSNFDQEIEQIINPTGA